MGRQVGVITLGSSMNTIKSCFKQFYLFLNDRILPHPVRIALIGDAESGKTTLLRSIDDRKYGYPLDDNAAKRMDSGVPDQETVEIPYRVFGKHGFRDFKVKDYKGIHLMALHFYARILSGTEGVVVLVRSSQFLKNPKEAPLLKSRYLDVCQCLHGIRAAVLLDVAPEEVVDESSVKAKEAFLEELRKAIIAAGVPETATKCYSFQKPTTDNLTLEEKRDTARCAASPFLWLAEQLDKSIWTWIRTRWWTWMLLVFAAVVLAVSLITSVVRSCIPPSDISNWRDRLTDSAPQEQTWNDWKRHRKVITNCVAWTESALSKTCATDGKFAEFVTGHKVKNDELLIELLAEELTANTELMSLVGKEHPDIESFGGKLDNYTLLAPQNQETSDRIRELRKQWRGALENYKPSDSPSDEITRTYRILTSSWANSQLREETKEKRQDALETFLKHELGRFSRETKEPAMSGNGLTQDMENLREYLFPNEVEEWRNAIASCRSNLIQDQIEEWRNLDARPLLRKYASFAKQHEDNPFLPDATDFVAHTVDSKLDELLEILKASLRNPLPERVEAGKKAFQDLRGLCNSIRGEMVQGLPSFGNRWESQFADEFWNASSQKDGKGMEHLLEFEEVFGWRLTISMVKIHADKGEYWVSLKEKSNEGSKWIVPPPEGVRGKIILTVSNVGNVYRLSGEKKVIRHNDNPFARYNFNMHVCRRGEIAEFQEVKSASVNGAELFFQDRDENGQSCRKMEVTNDKTKAKIGCAIYGTESERLLPKLENIVNRGGAQ